MIVRLGTAPRRETLDFEQFQQHWRTSHADVVSRLPGLRSYDQFHAVLESGRPVLEYPGFDACSALRFDSLDDMDAAFDSPTFRGAVQSDENEFVDKSRFRGVIGQWRPVVDDVLIGDLGDVVLLRLWSAPDTDDSSRLATLLSEQLPASSAGLLVADRAAHDGRFPVAADVVEATGHATVGDARADLERRERDDLPGTLIGQHLAHVVHVPIDASRTGSTDEGTRA
jgi:uncharacterized protein (TIGR02118 family)